jgi:hypothetical protein
MTVENFRPEAVKTSSKVKRFYKSLSNGSSYNQTWADTIKDFDNKLGEENKLKQIMEEEYKDEKCSCGLPCVVRKTETSRNNNRGRWYIKCPDHYGSHHTFKFVKVPLREELRAAGQKTISSFFSPRKGTW